MIAAAAGSYRPASRLDELPADVVRRIDRALERREDTQDAVLGLQQHANIARPAQWVRALADSKVAVDGLIAAYQAAREHLVAESVGRDLLDVAVGALRTVYQGDELARREYEQQMRHAPAVPHDSAVLDAAEWLSSVTDRQVQCRVGIGTPWAHSAHWTDKRTGRHECSVLAAHEARTAAAAGSAGDR